MKKLTILALAFCASTSISLAQYNSCAGSSEIKEAKAVTRFNQETKREETVVEYVPVTNTDTYGNVKGNEYDLAKDFAFKGQTIVVLKLNSNSFSGPAAALAEKGFGTFEFNGAPQPHVLKAALEKANQVWIISNVTLSLTEEHAKLIKEFYETGRGVYIWGDNDPCNADANFIANYLIGASLTGDYYADKSIGLKSDSTSVGIRKDHLISTGIVQFYEGITVSHVVDPQEITTPLMWSSDGQVVAAIVDDQQHRLILDGGFTRLSYKWDSAGTGRYIKNAAAWLANVERFGDEVVSEEFKTDKKQIEN